jgi:iron complex outermembrane receptor protein
MSINVILICLAGAFPILSAASDIDPLDTNIQTVLSPTRLRQSLADVPASVTIITSDMLQKFGITSIPDALRLVPGMAVTQVSGNDYRISYHGTNILTPKRMDVLIDGMSVYSPAISSVNWTNLPVVIEDIDRIEVTRGPDSVSYGPNSMLAVVSIITKHPKAVEGTTLMAGVGSSAMAEGMARYAGQIGESTSYRVTIDRQKDGGFDASSIAQKDHDGTRLDRVNFQSISTFGYNESLDLQASVVQGTNEIPYVDKYQQTLPDMQLTEYYVNAIWKKDLSLTHDVQVQAYAVYHINDQAWVSCPPTAMFLPQLGNLWKADPSYANAILAGHIPSGGTAQDNALAAAAIAAIKGLGARAAQPTCANANQNYVERRYDAEIQDTLVLSDALRMVNGVGVRQDMGDSQTFLDGRVTNTNYRVFSNVEYRPATSVSINVGGFLETDQITGTAFSPRTALNWHISDNQTLRFIVAKGNRMPDILEQDANWSYHASFPVPINGSTQGSFFQSARAPGNLNSEKILSREIGYFGNFPQYGLLIDAKAFNDSLTDLISQKMQVSSFMPTNNNGAHLTGAEFQINYVPTDRSSVFLNYAYLHSDDVSTPLEQTQYSNNMGSVGITHRFDNAWSVSLASYGSGASTAAQTFYGREDLILSKAFNFGASGRVSTNFTVRHLDNLTSRYYVDVNQINTSSYTHGMQYYGTIKYSY